MRSLLTYNGVELISRGPRHKMVFVFASRDLNIPLELSLANIRRVDPAMRVDIVPDTDHNFRSAEGSLSQEAVKQIAEIIRHTPH